MKKKALIWVLIAIPIALLVYAVAVVILQVTPSTVVSSSAQARVWVALDMQPQLLEEMHSYAEDKQLIFTNRRIPAPWNMIEIRLTTPRGSQIELINATNPDQYSASILVSDDDKLWQDSWKDFKAYVGTRHKWKDIP